LALLLWVSRFALKLVRSPHDGRYVICNLSKAPACDFTRQIEAVSTPTLGADKPTAFVLVVPPETVSPAAHGARTVLVDEESAVHTKGNEQVPPITLCYRPNVVHLSSHVLVWLCLGQTLLSFPHFSQ
jgi:hypothetical protein